MPSSVNYPGSGCRAPLLSSHHEARKHFVVEDILAVHYED